MKGYEIRNEQGMRKGNRIWKTQSKAKTQIRQVIKNNDEDIRKQTGWVGLKVKSITLNAREEEEMKKAKDFIFD